MQQRAACHGGSRFQGSSSSDFLFVFALTGHLLDPAEGSQVTGGGGLLEQLMEKEEREREEVSGEAG